MFGAIFEGKIESFGLKCLKKQGKIAQTGSKCTQVGEYMLYFCGYCPKIEGHFRVSSRKQKQKGINENVLIYYPGNKQGRRFFTNYFLGCSSNLRKDM